MLAASCGGDEPLLHLFNWLIRHNATLSPKLEMRCSSSFNRGVFVTSNSSIETGAELATVPLLLLMTLERAMQEPALSASGARGTNLIALFLLQQRADPSSFWHPYAAALPKEISTTLAWSEADLAELQASELRLHAFQRARAVDRHWRALPPALRGTKNDWAWALTQVWSRGHTVGKQGVLPPLIDMFNNGPQANVGPARIENYTLVVRATRPMQPGEEATVPYGNSATPLPNQRLMVRKGDADQDRTPEH